MLLSSAVCVYNNFNDKRLIPLIQEKTLESENHTQIVKFPFCSR